MIAAVATVVVIGAVAGITIASGGGAGKHTITGRIQYAPGFSHCLIDSANDVSVADENETVLAAAVMSPIHGSGGDCFEDFTISDVPDASVYQFLESGFVVLTISHDDLAAKNFNVGVILQS